MAIFSYKYYFNDGANQQYALLSGALVDYSLSTEQYHDTCVLSGFRIDFVVFPQTNGYCIYKQTIQSVNSVNDWNRCIFTYSTYSDCYTSTELDLDIGVQNTFALPYTNSTYNVQNPIIFNLVFYNNTQNDVYEVAYNTGFDSGYELGYNEGVNSGESGFTGTFELLGQAFGSLGNIMSVNVIGGLTIGSLIGIPLTITIVITLFKILRK